MRVLEAKDVTKRFGAETILSGVAMSLAPGEACVVSGANGAGKSTLFDVIAGILEPDAGEVAICGVARTNRRAALAEVGYAPSNAALPEGLTVHETVDLVASLRRGASGARGEISRRDQEGLEKIWGLDAFLDSPLSVLSLGQRRRLVLMLSELGRPRLWLLDEPTVGLDAAGRALLLERLREHLASGGAALVASHEPEVAEAIGAKRKVMEKGKIA